MVHLTKAVSASRDQCADGRSRRKLRMKLLAGGAGLRVGVMVRVGLDVHYVERMLRLRLRL